ncbi:ATP-binding protein [Mesorhizobium sp. M1340]|uniref:AlbA family DNA-binding domain-containing protein n=1 Tax=Mesorhizobium sp. M1340 TaxID=2957087 RepID=UPI00333A21A5
MGLPGILADLIDYDFATLRVTSRESRKLEFKQAFLWAQVASYERTLAAFANTQGGTMIFGVDGKPRVIVGTDPAKIADEADLTTMLKQDFAPEIPFETKVYEVNGLTVYAICVEAAVDRPVICQKDRTKRTLDAKGGNPRDDVVITEATIYYRYSAQTSAIKYTELKALLDGREERRLQMLLETIKAVERVGYDKVGVVDATTFGDADKSTNLYVSRETAKSMNFIDRGKFVETTEDGAPAYVVVGKVKLGEVVRAPLEDADKNLPGEVAEILKPDIQRLYGPHTVLPSYGVLALLTAFGLLDLPYHEYDTKLRRRYVTREGVKALKQWIATDPLKALKAFGSKKVIKTLRRSRIDGSHACRHSRRCGSGSSAVTSQTRKVRPTTNA